MAQHQLRLVFWETTAGCNLECAHCRRIDVSRQLSRGDLTTDEAYRLIDQIAEVGSPVLVFSGGESLLRPDLFRLVAHARRRGLPTAIATNGTLVDEPRARVIAMASVDRVSISIDGADAATHDAFRRQSGAFDRAIRGLELLGELKVSRQINTTVTRHNAEQLDAIYQLAVRLDVDAIHFFMFVPVGCGLEIPADQQLASAQYEATLEWLADRSLSPKPFVRSTCAPQYFRILAKRGQLHRQQYPHARLASLTKGCLAGTGICFISHKGEVFPCGYLPAECGDVRRQSFGEIWRESPVFAQMRDSELLEGKCGLCEFKRICGGCRARAFAESGDYLAEEPCCSYEPRDAEKRESLSQRGLAPKVPDPIGKIAVKR